MTLERCYNVTKISVIKIFMKVTFDSFKTSVKKIPSSAILILVLSLLVVAGIILVRDYDFQGMMANVSQRAGEIETALFPRNDVPRQLALEGDMEDSVEVFPVQEVKLGSYREKAQPGDGLTHLARRAISSYLREKGKTLSGGQRIYAEDYIQRRISGGSRWLEVGEEVEISWELISEAIQRAEQLGQSEIANLQIYAAGVVFP